MKKLLIVLLLLALSGCVSICRYQVLANAAWAIENGKKVDFVIYTTIPVISMGVYNAHIQASFVEDGKRYWISNDNRYVSEDTDYSMGEYCWKLTLEQYIEWLKDNKELGARGLPSKEYRDRYWPKTKDFLGNS